jgi:hypothetical protein
MPASVNGESPPTAPAYLRAAIRLGTAFLAALLVVAIFTISDYASSAKLESFSETTAAGDMNLFRVPELGEPVFLWQGKRYVLSSREKVKIDDTDMVRAGTEETGDYVFYSRRGASSQELFVKIAVGEFLPVRAQ